MASNFRSVGKNKLTFELDFEDLCNRFQLCDGKVIPENLVNAVMELVTLARSKGFDDEARVALSACGITLEIEEKKEK